MIEYGKKCWTCDARTHYTEGLCPACEGLLPAPARAIYRSRSDLPQPFLGLINTALCDGLASLRRSALPPLSLEDLDI